MTEEYRDKIILRIKRLNYSGFRYLRRTALPIFICICALLCGFLMSFAIEGASKGAELIFEAHFCCFFEKLDFLASMRAAVGFALPDFLYVIAFFLFGYTMLSGAAGRLILFLYGVRLGLCIGFIYDYLIVHPHISGGTSAFILFSVCKLIVFIALVFSALRSEDFSYSFAESFLKCRNPYFCPPSVSYLKCMLSSAGFTVLINMIYLIFQSLSDFVTL